MRATILCLILTMFSGITSAIEPTVQILDDCYIEVAPLEGIDFDCGRLVVPEFHETDNGRAGSIPFIRFKSPGGSSAAPLFKTHGGPGGSELQFVTSQIHMELHKPILQARDVVLFNQRGSMFAEPWLTCTEENASARQAIITDQLHSTERRTALNAAIQACYDRFTTHGIDFDAFNSLQIAADVNALRVALGYDTIFFHGSSYGTILAQHMIREYPETLEGVILDGSLGLEEQSSWVEKNIVIRTEFWDLVFAECTTVSGCADSFPDLSADFETLVTRYATQPFILDYGDIQIAVDDLRLIEKLQSWATTAGSLRAEQVPLIINSLANSQDTAFITTIMKALFPLDSFRDLGDGPSAAMAHYAITCSEDPVTGLDNVFNDGLFPAYAVSSGLDDAANYDFACPLLNVPALPEAARANVSTEIPVLFMNGQLDNATVPSWNHNLMDFYGHEFAFTFPLSHHVQYYKLPTQPCGAMVLTQFINAPTIEPDGSCISSLPMEYEYVLPQ